MNVRHRSISHSGSVPESRKSPIASFPESNPPEPTRARRAASPARGPCSRSVRHLGLCILAWGLCLAATGCHRAAPPASPVAIVRELYALTLYDALENHDLQILIPRENGRWEHALVLTPRWSQAAHEADLSKLRLSGGRIGGEILVSLHPNATWPFPGAVPQLLVHLSATVSGQTITGSFRSVYDGVTAVGKLAGSLRNDDPHRLDDCRVVLRLEKATPIELQDWQRELNVGFVWRRGEPSAGRLVGPSQEAVADPSDVLFDVSNVSVTTNRLAGEIVMTPPGGSAVRYRVRGIVVGDRIGGVCEMSLGNTVESRRLLGEIRPVVRKAARSSSPPSSVSAAVVRRVVPRATRSPMRWELPREGDDLDQALDLARRTLALVERVAARPEAAEALRALEARAAQSQGKTDAARNELLDAVCRLRRRILFSHPALDFDRLLINQRSAALPEHMVDQYLGRHSQPAPGLVILESWKDAPRPIPLTCGRLPEGALLHPDLSYDGRRVLFAFCDHAKHAPPEHRAYFIYEMELASGRVRQVTGTPADLSSRQSERHTALVEDVDPCYLPDGGIAFVSTRCQTFGRCNGVRYSPSFTLHRADLDGAHIRPLSYNEANDWWPSVLENGLLVYTRWDYINRNDVFFQSLWTTRPDGTATAHYYKNNSAWPCLVGEARAIPHSHQVVATAAAHHGQTLGTIVVVDPLRGQEGGKPLTVITPELPFPESGTPAGAAFTPLPPRLRTPESRHLRDRRAGTPYPLSEDLFLVAYPHGGKLAIYLIDSLGGRELIYRDPAVACMDPIPLRASVPPPAVLAQGGQSPPLTGRVYVQDVYEGASPIPRGSICGLRVNQILGQPTRAKPCLSRVDNEILKRILGTVPVGDDGSAAFEVPAGIPLQFQLLDANGMAVMTMRSQVYLQPGERLACIGCHEPRQTAPRCTFQPASARVERLTPPAGPSYEGGLSFARTVQPVLDRYCIACHGLQTTEKICLLGSLENRPGEPAAPPRRFAVSYDALLDVPGLVCLAQRNEETYPSQPDDYFARAGRLAAMLRDGHPDATGRKRVELDPESLQRIIDWLDLNAPYYGDYSFNRSENQPPRPAGERALRAAIAERFGLELARQPFAALVNTALPAESRILKAPLATRAGGWGQIDENGWESTGDPDYQAMRALVEGAIAPPAFHDIAGTCGREDACRCGSCWVRRHDTAPPAPR